MDYISREEYEKIITRGRIDAYQDDCEGCPFASIGGPENRQFLSAPDYIKGSHLIPYMTGYIEMCKHLYGPFWQTR